MDAYNQKLLAKAEDAKILLSRLSGHWGIKPEDAAACVACGRCESACTQHLDIIERLKYIAAQKAG
jgi:predicted aldo/keto reductase-like oxidoreductase